MPAEPATPLGDPAEPVEPRILVVVVTHVGSGDMLQRCVRSIHDAGGATHVIVVDNSAPGVDDPDLGPHREVEEPDLGIDIMLRVPNDGYGAAFNRGLDEAEQRWPDTHDAIAVLNDDTQVTVGWLGPLLDGLRADSRLGAVQPKLLLGGTSPALVNSVGVTLDETAAGSDLGHGRPDGPEWSTPGEIEIFTGGAVLFRPAFLADTGGFDERYFLYYEDVDLALRGAERGWRFRCEPASVVWHEPGSSTAALGSGLVRLQERNRLWAAFRFGSPATVRRAVWLSVRRLRHAPRRTHAHALLTGVAAMPRILVERRRAR